MQKMQKPFHTGQFWSQIDRESTFELNSSITIESKRKSMLIKSAACIKEKRV